MEVNGVKYRLTPISPVGSILDQYAPSPPISSPLTGSPGEANPPITVAPVPAASTGSTRPGAVPVAVPRVSDYRERYKKHQVFLDDVSAPPTLLKQIPHQDRELDKFEFEGEKLFFGEGIQQEL